MTASRPLFISSALSSVLEAHSQLAGTIYAPALDAPLLDDNTDGDAWLTFSVDADGDSVLHLVYSRSAPAGPAVFEVSLWVQAGALEGWLESDETEALFDTLRDATPGAGAHRAALSALQASLSALPNAA